MMSTLKTEVFTKHRHKTRVREQWGSLEKKGDLCIKEKIRLRVCECGYQKRDRTREKESYGSTLFRGNIGDLLPSELVPVARQILGDLLKANNNKRFLPWRQKILKIYSYTLFDEAVSALWKMGVLVKGERLGQRSTYWEISKLYYNQDYLEQIKQFLGVVDQENPFWIDEPFPPLPSSPRTKEGKLLQQVLEKQREGFLKNGHATLYTDEGEEVISSKANRLSYLKTIRLLYSMFHTVEKGEYLSWKTFSQQYFGDTKALNSADKRRIEMLVGQDVSRFGIYRDRHEIILSGDFTWEWQGHGGDSRAFKDYIVFDLDMLPDLRLTSWSGEKVLIIENQDLFFNIVKRRLLDKKRWIVFYGAGYPSQEEMRFLCKGRPYGLKQVFVWPDIDPYGYDIALNVKKKISQMDRTIKVSLFGFATKWFERSPVYKKLRDVDVAAINRFLEDPVPASVEEILLLMKKRRLKTEQELLIRCLDDYILDEGIIKESVEIPYP